jgi:hypothetical protein
MKLVGVRRILDRAHEQTVQHRQFIVRMHTADELVTLAVREPLDRIPLDLQLDNLKVFHTRSDQEDIPRCS